MSKAAVYAVLSLMLAQANVALGGDCTSDADCHGWVCDFRAGGTCHDPCGTWFQQPYPGCHHAAAASSVDLVIQSNDGQTAEYSSLSCNQIAGKTVCEVSR